MYALCNMLFILKFVVGGVIDFQTGGLRATPATSRDLSSGRTILSCTTINYIYV